MKIKICILLIFLIIISCSSLSKNISKDKKKSVISYLINNRFDENFDKYSQDEINIVKRFNKDGYINEETISASNIILNKYIYHYVKNLNSIEQYKNTITVNDKNLVIYKLYEIVEYFSNLENGIIEQTVYSSDKKIIKGKSIYKYINNKFISKEEYDNSNKLKRTLFFCYKDDNLNNIELYDNHKKLIDKITYEKINNTEIYEKHFEVYNSKKIKFDNKYDIVEVVTNNKKVVKIEYDYNNFSKGDLPNPDEFLNFVDGSVKILQTFQPIFESLGNFLGLLFGH